MRTKRPLILIVVLIFVSLFSGCISGGDDATTDTTPSQSPTVTAPATTPAVSTLPPTTLPPTVNLTHSECSTCYEEIDSGNTRYYDCEISTDLQESWKRGIMMSLSCIMADYGRLYFIESEYGSYHLKCLDAETGDLYWSSALPFLGFYDLVLQDEKLYVFEDGDEKTLICYDAHDGALLWTSADVCQEYPEITDMMANSLSCSDGKVIVRLNSTGELDRSILCCFNGSNGSLSWSRLLDYSISPSPAIENGVAYFSTISWENNDMLIGIDITDGDLTYVYSNALIDYFNARRIVVSDGMIYAFGERMDTYKLYLFCISISSNNLVWQCQLEKWGNLTVDSEHVFVALDDAIACIDKDGGQKLWSIPMDYHRVNYPIATSGMLLVFRAHYLTEIPPEIIAIDASTGDELWSVILEGDYLQRGASFYEDKMYVSTDLGYIYCFE